jgi:hypothetical protein
MKIKQLIAVPLLLLAVVIGGCGQSTNSGEAQPSASASPSPSAEAPVKPLAKDEILTLLSEAAKLDHQIYAQKSHTEDEVYAHYEPHFTRGYVERIVLGGGNLKKEGEQWVIANEGGESIEGTFINEIDKDNVQIVTAEDGKTITVTNPVGDGLYAPHKEEITILYTDGAWKIDDLKWL